jgi:predicted kinase
VPPLPTLVVVSGPAGSGKTTLAHAIASAVGCPAISRDEIKEGMVHATWGPAAPGGVAPDRGASSFVARPGDELTARTLPVFFGVLELLVRAGVTIVAEAAFQDHVWRPRLEPLLGLAKLRIVHCVVDGDLAARRILRRTQDNPSRRAHADLHPETSRLRRTFNRLSLDVPSLEVDTTDGYRPGLDQIVAFVNDPRSGGTDGA